MAFYTTTLLFGIYKYNSERGSFHPHDPWICPCTYQHFPKILPIILILFSYLYLLFPLLIFSCCLIFNSSCHFQVYFHHLYQFNFDNLKAFIEVFLCNFDISSGHAVNRYKILGTVHSHNYTSSEYT